MRRILLIVAAALAVLLAGCKESVDYKAKSEQYAKQVDELCEQQADTTAVMAMVDSLFALEEQVVATNDSAVIADYESVKKAAKDRSDVYRATVKLNEGVDRQEVVDEMLDEVLVGKSSIIAVTAAIDSAKNMKK